MSELFCVSASVKALQLWDPSSGGSWKASLTCHNAVSHLLTLFFTRADQSKYSHFEDELMILSSYCPLPQTQQKRELCLYTPCFPNCLSVLLEQLTFHWSNIKMPPPEFKDKLAGEKTPTKPDVHLCREEVRPNSSSSGFSRVPQHTIERCAPLYFFYF